MPAPASWSSATTDEGARSRQPGCVVAPGERTAPMAVVAAALARQGDRRRARPEAIRRRRPPAQRRASAASGRVFADLRVRPSHALTPWQGDISRPLVIGWSRTFGPLRRNG